MKKILLLISMLTFCISVNAARMYQWIDPDTRTTQLSGKPPYWYRNGEEGPRVVVFENGKVIDDTGIELSEAENTRMRQEALMVTEEDQSEALQRMAQTLRQRAVLDPDSEEEEEIVQPVIESIEEEPDSAETEDEADVTAITEQKRDLLQQYESIETQNDTEQGESERR